MESVQASKEVRFADWRSTVLDYSEVWWLMLISFFAPPCSDSHASHPPRTAVGSLQLQLQFFFLLSFGCISSLPFFFQAGLLFPCLYRVDAIFLYMYKKILLNSKSTGIFPQNNGKRRVNLFASSDDDGRRLRNTRINASNVVHSLACSSF